MRNNPFPESNQISPRQVMQNIADRAKARIQSGFVDPEEEKARVRKQLSDYAKRTTQLAFRSVTHNSIAGMSVKQALRESQRTEDLLTGGNYLLMESGIRSHLNLGNNLTGME